MTLAFIPDLVEQHYDELQFLWRQRRRALRLATYTQRALEKLEDRIEAHVDGLLVIGDRVPEFVAPGLAGEDDLAAFASAFTLLRLPDPVALALVADTLEGAQGPKVNGLRDALAHGPSAALTPRLTALLESGRGPLAPAAGEALVFRGAAAPVAAQLERFIVDEDPATRASGWRLAGYSGTAMRADSYAAGLHDEDPGVHGAALTAAAWSASPAFQTHCRALAEKPKPEAVDALSLYAAVAPPEQYQLVGLVAASPAAGPERFRVLGSFGHPYFVEQLIREMEHPDPATAAAAGTAFTKMTGRDVESNERATVSPDGKPPADEFEAEFQDDVFLPDPDLARRHWQELAPTLARSTRICRGMDVSQQLSREQFGALDMESRWEYCLRLRLFAGWQGTPLVLERYPQRF